MKGHGLGRGAGRANTSYVPSHGSAISITSSKIRMTSLYSNVKGANIYKISRFEVYLSQRVYSMRPNVNFRFEVNIKRRRAVFKCVSVLGGCLSLICTAAAKGGGCVSCHQAVIGTTCKISFHRAYSRI